MTGDGKLYAVRVRLSGSTISLFAKVGQFELPLVVRENGTIGYEAAVNYLAPLIKIKTKYEKGIFAIVCRDLYITARPDGTVFCGMPHHMNWEFFWIGLRRD